MLHSNKALPGILRVIVSWILNRAKEVVGWVMQNLWMLIITAVGLGWPLHT